MKKLQLFAAATLGSMMLSSCGAGGFGTQATGTQAQTAANGAAVISDILGQLLGGAATQSSIIGTWSYKEPAVQFESENLLAKAGGTIASRSVVNKLTPYFQNIGIVPGKCSFTFNEDNSCTYVINGKQYSGTYTYDQKNGTIQIKGLLFSFPSAYVTVSSRQMAMTFDASKLMTIAKTVGAMSGNSQLGTLSEILGAYNGMKTGFMFTR